uniref:Cytochrome b n=2 Tax=Epeurysa nawaii TaxID=1308479 RepID=A0A7S4YYR2_9HEMI|nr:cytochrome b [Epeurysa nawaii]QBZ38002.1 cytochrome b [Epeurysa nawaii]QBZ38015.1 cytochrome b [Epeurysa nawaii]
MKINSKKMNILNKFLINLPTPSNISYWWNFGSILGLCLMIQLISGIFLSMHYSPSIYNAFESVIHINRNVNYGWLMRLIHANGASLFFFIMFIHTGRGMYYGSFIKKKVWFSGTLIMLMLMGTAFLGYVLPWGQMSFWGATVITNLMSAIPYLGNMMVTWVWGGFSVDNPTLNRFFSLHFMLPFILTVFILMHLIFLHENGSSNPLGLKNKIDKISFHPYFSVKDIYGFVMTLFIFSIILFKTPFLFNDPENFTPANSMVTPPHIQPEWYFLFAYAILRSIPNKLGGVLALLMSILIILTLPFTMNSKFKSLSMYTHKKILFFMFVAIFILLTWIGAKPVEPPYVLMAQILTILYFSYFMLIPMKTKLIY